MLKASLAVMLLTLPAVVPAQARAQASDPAPAAIENDFPIRPGDEVQVRIWRQEDMSQTYLVSPEGTITLPLLDEVPVTNRSLRSIKDELIERYSQYLRAPSIEVIIRRRVAIGGAVNNPSLYNVDPTVTVSGAIALAGGPTPNGDPTKVQLRRDGQVLTTFVNQYLNLADSPLRSGDQLFVPERSWFERNSNVLTAGISASVSIFIALLISRNRN